MRLSYLVLTVHSPSGTPKALLSPEVSRALLVPPVPVTVTLTSRAPGILDGSLNRAMTMPSPLSIRMAGGITREFHSKQSGDDVHESAGPKSTPGVIARRRDRNDMRHPGCVKPWLTGM